MFRISFNEICTLRSQREEFSSLFRGRSNTLHRVMTLLRLFCVSVHGSGGRTTSRGRPTSDGRRDRTRGSWSHGYLRLPWESSIEEFPTGCSCSSRGRGLVSRSDRGRGPPAGRSRDSCVKGCTDSTLFSLCKQQLEQPFPDQNFSSHKNWTTLHVRH